MKHTLAAVGLVVIGVAIGLGAGFYAWHIPRSARDCVLQHVKSGMSTEIARILRDTCEGRFPRPAPASALEPAKANPFDQFDRSPPRNGRPAAVPTPADKNPAAGLFDDLIPKKGTRTDDSRENSAAEPWWKKYEEKAESLPEKDSQSDQ